MKTLCITVIMFLAATTAFVGCKKDDVVDPIDQSNQVSQIIIDSRTESLMIDQIQGAKRVALTTGRAYRLTLASNATPIHDRVCVMYQSTSGLTCDMLMEGSSLQFTTGYSQLYLWLIDWSTTADNTGSATITVTDLSNSSNQTVVISSQSESILLDGRPEVKFQTIANAKRYTVSLNSTATPIPDKVFMMYQSVESGLVVDIVSEGGSRTFTSQYTQCAFFMPDWSTRADNTGSATVSITPN
jgi:hypothetical protein